MGVWSYNLYGNDITCDVKETYMEALKTADNDNDAFISTLKAFEEIKNTDEECLVWYAIADIQWKTGRLTEFVKERALDFLNKGEGRALFDNQNKWVKTLDKLREQLLLPMKGYRIIKKDVTELLDLWESGDVYAYQFSTQYAKEKGLFGKYILMQKADEVEGYKNKRFSVIHIFDKLFDDIPDPDEIRHIRLLPCDTSYRATEDDKDFPLCMSAVMEYDKAGEYPKSRLTFLGKEKITAKTSVYQNRSNYCWYRLEQNWLCDFYLEWQGKEYYQEDEAYFPYKV